jgi:hypothetical protein
MTFTQEEMVRTGSFTYNSAIGFDTCLVLFYSKRSFYIKNNSPIKVQFTRLKNQEKAGLKIAVLSINILVT